MNVKKNVEERMLSQWWLCYWINMKEALMFILKMLFFLKLDTLSQVEEESLLRNDLRPANKLAKGNRLFMRFATKGKCDIWH